jgi:hypothetical protein
MYFLVNINNNCVATNYCRLDELLNLENDNNVTITASDGSGTMLYGSLQFKPNNVTLNAENNIIYTCIYPDNSDRILTITGAKQFNMIGGILSYNSDTINTNFIYLNNLDGVFNMLNVELKFAENKGPFINVNQGKVSIDKLLIKEAESLARLIFIWNSVQLDFVNCNITDSKFNYTEGHLWVY